MAKQTILTTCEKQVEFNFPIYRTYLDGEYGFPDYKKQYWKFESNHKVTVITERQCETTILTYDDKNADFVREILTNNMFECLNGWDAVPEIVFDKCVQRLIDKLFVA